MYVYGGQEINTGILSDFWRIKIVNTNQFLWEEIILNN